MEQQQSNIKNTIQRVAQSMQPPYKKPNLPYTGQLSKAATKVLNRIKNK